MTDSSVVGRVVVYLPASPKVIEQGAVRITIAAGRVRLGGAKLPLQRPANMAEIGWVEQAASTVT